MSWLDPISGNRAATDADYASAITNYHTPYLQYLNAKVLGGTGATSFGELFQQATLPPNAVQNLSDDQVRDIYNLLPRAQQYPYSGPNLPPTDPQYNQGKPAETGTSTSSLYAGSPAIPVRQALPQLYAQLSPEEREIITPQVQARLKQFGINYLSKAQYENSPWSRPNLSYEEFTTPDRASARADVYDINQFRAWQIQQRQNGVFGAVTGFIAGMVGGAPEPINFLGFGVGSDVALTSARSIGLDLAKSVGGNAAIFAGLGAVQQLSVRPMMQYFGDDITYAQMLEGIAINAAIGAAFGAAGTVFRASRGRIGVSGKGDASGGGDIGGADSGGPGAGGGTAVDARPLAKEVGETGKPLGNIATVDDPMRGVSADSGPAVGAVPPVAPIVEGGARIFDDVFQKARDAGVAPEEAATYAALYASRYTARAERLGLNNAFDLYNEKPLTIRRSDEPGRVVGPDTLRNEGEIGTKLYVGADIAKLEADLRASGVKLDDMADLLGSKNRVRGEIQFADSGPIITLFKDADRSTLLHETGHLWLDELHRDATGADAPAGLKSDLDTFAKWVGKEDVTKITREDHEKFARAFETYLMEGRAPIPALQSLFERFKQWLTSIYQTVARLNVPINDDIRGLMNRLLASDRQLTDAQIGAAKRDLNLAVMDLAVGRDPVGPDAQVGAMDAPASVSGDGWQPTPDMTKGPKEETVKDLAPDDDATEALYAALDKNGRLSEESKAEYQEALDAEAKVAKLEDAYRQANLCVMEAV